MASPLVEIKEINKNQTCRASSRGSCRSTQWPDVARTSTMSSQRNTETNKRGRSRLWSNKSNRGTRDGRSWKNRGSGSSKSSKRETGSSSRLSLKGSAAPKRDSSSSRKTSTRVGSSSSRVASLRHHWSLSTGSRKTQSSSSPTSTPRPGSVPKALCFRRSCKTFVTGSTSLTGGSGTTRRH